MGVPYQGKTSSAYFKTVQFLNLVGWSYALTCTTSDSTAAHATNTGRTREAGFTGGTATVTCKTSGDAQATIGDNGVLELLRGPTNAEKGLYVADAICTGIAPSADLSETENIVYTFQLTGAITGVTTEGT